jgi:hypothetical protein
MSLPSLRSPAQPRKPGASELAVPGFPTILAQARGFFFAPQETAYFHQFLMVILACPCSRVCWHERSEDGSGRLRLGSRRELGWRCEGNFWKTLAPYGGKEPGIPESALRVGRYLKSDGETFVAVAQPRRLAEHREPDPQTEAAAQDAAGDSQLMTVWMSRTKCATNTSFF